MVPPKDPYIKVRVLEEIGNVVLSDQVANLARHAILFLRRTDAEQYISQVVANSLQILNRSTLNICLALSFHFCLCTTGTDGGAYKLIK